MTTPDPRAADTVYFDGGCPVCTREIGWYRTMRGGERIAWIDIANGPTPQGVDRETLLKRFTIRRQDGAVVSGGPAFIALWRGLGPLRLLGRAMDFALFRTAAEVAYRGFLKLRSLWR